MSRIEHLKTFLTESPNDSFLKFAIAKEFEKLNNSEEALKYYLEIEDNDPNYVGLYFHLGKLYFGKGNIRKAYDTFSKGMSIAKSQKDDHAHAELASARMEIDEDDLD